MNQRIYNYSIHLLARQDYSEFKLRRKLLSKKDNLPHEVDEVLTALKERSLINEVNYRRMFIRKWMMKGESEEKIKKRGAMEKLSFDPEEFRLIEIELGFSNVNSIEKLIHKKMRTKKIPEDFGDLIKLKDKVLRFLILKGHDYNDAKSALQKYIQSL